MRSSGREWKGYPFLSAKNPAKGDFGKNLILRDLVLLLYLHYWTSSTSSESTAAVLYLSVLMIRLAPT
ncbi:hypothetical protein C7820_6608 [Paenibacillus sp. VMFN-D1]|nr:hypothetical protein C7820_6608 [Paenibacillus sp. VMFN-D1]